MWNIGQLLVHKKTKEPVIYLGFQMGSKKGMKFISEDGVIFYSTINSYTHITYMGNIYVGDFSINGAYFGEVDMRRLTNKHKQSIDVTFYNFNAIKNQIDWAY